MEPEEKPEVEPMSDLEKLEQMPENPGGIIKSKAGEFGHGRKIAPYKRQATEYFEDHFDALPRLVKQSLKVFEESMHSDNDKIRLDAANKFVGHFYKPTQKVEVDKKNTDVTMNIIQVNKLSDKERELLARAANLDGVLSEDAIIDVETIEETDG